ncbi:MAG: Hsp20/alpha crystallin family protein [Bacteroidia bacterium]
MSLTKTMNKGNLFPTVFSDFFKPDRFFNPTWLEGEFEQTMPAVNIKENGKQFFIEVAAPGFNKNDFKVNVEDDMLTISAEKREERSEENERFTRKEYFYNTFSRTFNLPQNSNFDKLDAKYENGILKLTLPKKEETKVSLKKEIKVA